MKGTDVRHCPWQLDARSKLSVLISDRDSRHSPGFAPKALTGMQDRRLTMYAIFDSKRMLNFCIDS